jgi:hypothetical protein
MAPNVYGEFFFGQIPIVLYWFLQTFFLAGSRVAYRYFRYTRRVPGGCPTRGEGRWRTDRCFWTEQHSDYIRLRYPPAHRTVDDGIQ